MILKNHQAQFVIKIINYFLWLFFMGNLAYLIYYFPNVPEIEYENILKINGFTVIIWTLVTFFSALISTYGKNYLNGFKYHFKFLLLCLGFTFSILVFVMANHVALILIMWLLMGVFMSQLIGVDSRWGEAREASLSISRRISCSTTNEKNK